jgi:hypothetical protein
MKKKRGVSDEPSMEPIDHFWHQILHLYGSKTTGFFDPLILEQYYPEGFGNGKATVAEYGIWLTMAAHKSLTEAQIRECQSFVKSSTLRKVLGRMVETNLLNRQGQNYSIRFRNGQDHEMIYTALLKAQPLCKQMVGAIEDYIQEFENRNGNGNGRHGSDRHVNKNSKK